MHTADVGQRGSGTREQKHLRAGLTVKTEVGHRKVSPKVSQNLFTIFYFYFFNEAENVNMAHGF